ncbi:MAG: xanthine dehydrogenase family protein molybdopterin-binding subunit [Candidatus Eremiobacteraeota bacterium]|nr:xanthine dehydrogenase family protein molybdopterin-binding subunit [Candidatus Eremiobacteraeota bacterium]
MDLPNTPPSVGAPLDRVDGRLKVTGGARYSAEMPVAGAVHAVMVTSTIARGRVRRADTRAAERVPGVLAVLTPGNAPRLPISDKALKQPPSGRKLTVLQDDRVYYNGQPIGLVVADTLEHATEAAHLVRFIYDVETPALEIAKTPIVPPPASHGGEAGKQKLPGSRRGDVAAGLAAAAVRVDHTYTTPFETHNPMEPHATLAVWEGDHLTLYDATQGVFGTRDTVAKAFQLPKEHVRVVSYFLGGGFGCKGSAWSHVILSAMAARQVGRPVKLVLTRRQMFGPVGGRPETVQRVTLGAAHDGTLTAERHLSTSNTSTLEDWLEPAAKTTPMLYACPNCEAEYGLARLNLGTPTYMRAPGEASGTFALESAMDELAIALRMDPIALRLKNYAEQDPESGHPWSSKSLRECYRVGAERFGWSRRTPAPRSMTDGRWLVGYGMATATYPTNRSQASAVARILPDGRGLVRSGTQDIGTGTYTVMTQVAADALGIPTDRVRFELGDTEMPQTPVSGGSQTAASVSPAVKEAGNAARDKVIAMAVADARSPLHGAAPADVRASDGRLSLAVDPSRGESYAEILARNGGQPVEARAEAKQGDEKEQYAMHAFGAVFTEVRVDRDLGEIRVPRVVGVYGVGNRLNAKTAHSQLVGGIIFGLGMALMEETYVDRRLGRYLNANLAEYHVPTNADVRAIDVQFVDEHDPYVNPLGIKGIGEIGITGLVASVANAAYHATGKRVRDLPLTLDKLL